MPITTLHIPDSRTLSQWGKLTASQTRVIRFLLVNHFIECPQELVDLGIQNQTLISMYLIRLLDRVVTTGPLGYCYSLSPAAILALAHWGSEHGVQF